MINMAVAWCILMIFPSKVAAVVESMRHLGVDRLFATP
jgi:hypothetical protein